MIYTRVSSVGDRQSTAQQVRNLSDYALYMKMDVCKVFNEHWNDYRDVLKIN